MWIGIKGVTGNQAREIDNTISTLWAQTGKVVGPSKGVRKVLEEHYRSLGTGNMNTKLDMGFEKKYKLWAEENVEASKQVDSSAKQLEREMSRDEVEEWVAKLKKGKVAGADERVNEVRGRGNSGHDCHAE